MHKFITCVSVLLATREVQTLGNLKVSLLYDLFVPVCVVIRVSCQVEVIVMFELWFMKRCIIALLNCLHNGACSPTMRV